MIKYRPEIDGLRAVAVLSVIFYHAHFHFKDIFPFKGGFLGVDVFFVISGYLITYIILGEAEKGTFSFRNFYLRRARRILPALFTVMLACLPFAWVYLLPKAMKEFAGSGLATLAFGSNFWFWREDSYTSEASELKPLLHTWSLSVEEQFYVFFPIILLLIWKFARHHLANILIIVAALSLIMAQYGSEKYVDATFYLLPTRGWELLAGAILAKFSYSHGRLSNAFLDRTMPALGLLLILLSVLFLNDEIRHPSLLTVPSVLGAMLVIWFAKKGEFFSNLLSSKPIVGIGVISYSLYLWHVPIFAFVRIAGDNFSNIDKVLFIALSIALSIITYLYIEKPFRSSVKKRTFFIMLGIFFILNSVVYYAFYHLNGVPSRFPLLQQLQLDKVNYRKIYREGLCYLSPQNMLESNPLEQCRKQENFNTQLPTLFLWGDSHAAHLYAGVEHNFGDDYNIVQRNFSGCHPIAERQISGRPTCDELNAEVIQEIIKMNPEFLVIAGRRMRDYDLFEKTLKTLKESTQSKIILVGSVPEWKDGLPKVALDYFHANRALPERLNVNVDIPYTMNQTLGSLAKKMGVSYLDSSKVFCENDACLDRIGNSLTAWDYGHLTVSGSIYLTKELEPFLK